MLYTQSLERKNKIAAFLLAGLWFALFALLIGGALFWLLKIYAPPPTDNYFRAFIVAVLCPTFATFVCGGLFARIILRYDRCQSGRAVGRGMLTVFFAFIVNIYLSLFMMGIIAAFERAQNTNPRMNYHSAASDGIELINLLIISTFAGVIVGAMLSPVGGFAGWLLHKLVRRPLGQTPKTPAP